MMMKSAPVRGLRNVPAEFLLQFFDSRARCASVVWPDGNQFAQSDRLRQIRQPVFCWLLLCFRPLDQQPLLRMRLTAPVVAMGHANAQAGKRERMLPRVPSRQLTRRSRWYSGTRPALSPKAADVVHPSAQPGRTTGSHYWPGAEVEQVPAARQKSKTGFLRHIRIPGLQPLTKAVIISIGISASTTARGTSSFTSERIFSFVRCWMRMYRVASC